MIGSLEPVLRERVQTEGTEGWGNAPGAGLRSVFSSSVAPVLGNVVGTKQVSKVPVAQMTDGDQP